MPYKTIGACLTAIFIASFLIVVAHVMAILNVPMRVGGQELLAASIFEWTVITLILCVLWCVGEGKKVQIILIGMIAVMVISVAGLHCPAILKWATILNAAVWCIIDYFMWRGVWNYWKSGPPKAEE